MMKRYACTALLALPLGAAPARAQTVSPDSSMNHRLKGLQDIPIIVRAPSGPAEACGITTQNVVPPAVLTRTRDAGLRLVLPKPDASGQTAIATYLSVQDEVQSMQSACIDRVSFGIRINAPFVKLPYNGLEVPNPFPIWEISYILVARKDDLPEIRAKMIDRMTDYFTQAWAEANR